MSRILSAPLSELLTSNKNNKNNNSINALHWKIFWNMQFTVGKYLKESLVGKILAFNQHIMNSKSCLLWVVQCQSLGWNSKLKLIKQFHTQHLSALFARRNPWFSQQNMTGTAPTQWAVKHWGGGGGGRSLPGKWGMGPGVSGENSGPCLLRAWSLCSYQRAQFGFQERVGVCVRIKTYPGTHRSSCHGLASQDCASLDRKGPLAALAWILTPEKDVKSTYWNLRTVMLSVFGFQIVNCFGRRLDKLLTSEAV